MPRQSLYLSNIDPLLTRRKIKAGRKCCPLIALENNCGTAICHATVTAPKDRGFGRADGMVGLARSQNMASESYSFVPRKIEKKDEKLSHGRDRAIS